MHEINCGQYFSLNVDHHQHMQVEGWANLDLRVVHTAILIINKLSIQIDTET